MESNYYYRQERGRGDSRRIESGNLYSIAGFAQQVSLLYDGMAGDLCVDLRIARLRGWLLDYWGLATVGIKTCRFDAFQFWRLPRRWQKMIILGRRWILFGFDG